MNTSLLYIDESGDSGWLPEHGGSSNEPYFIYAGVVLTPAENYELKQKLNNIINEYFTGWQRPEEIHYAEICHKTGVYENLDDEELQDLRDDLFRLILDIEPVLMASVVDKARMKERYGDWANPPKRYCFRSIVDRFHMQLEEDDDVGMITMDASDRSVDTRLRNFIYNAQGSGISLPGTQYKEDSTLPRIMDTVTVTPSEMSPGIQIADIVAYQVRHKYRYESESNGFSLIEHLFRDPDGASLTEPSVIPAQR